MTLTFDQLEKAAIVREISEKSQNFLKWAKENKRSPENFCDWDKIIIDFYKEKEEEWKEPVAINCPYGFMGYEIFYPPKPKIEEIKAIDFDKAGDFDWDLILNDSDDEDSEDENKQESADNQEENIQYEVWFNEGEETKGGFKSYEDIKEYFDTCVEQMKEYGIISIETPIKTPYHFACYAFDEDGDPVEDLPVEELDWSGDEEVEKNSCYQQDNPKKEGSKAYQRYNIYKTAKTFEEYKILHREASEKIKGSTTWRADLQYDFNKGFCFGFPDIKLSLNNDKLVIQ